MLRASVTVTFFSDLLFVICAYSEQQSAGQWTAGAIDEITEGCVFVPCTVHLVSPSVIQG
jgi:hypothetical protein